MDDLANHLPQDSCKLCPILRYQIQKLENQNKELQQQVFSLTLQQDQFNANQNQPTHSFKNIHKLDVQIDKKQSSIIQNFVQSKSQMLFNNIVSPLYTLEASNYCLHDPIEEKQLKIGLRLRAGKIQSTRHVKFDVQEDDNESIKSAKLIIEGSKKNLDDLDEIVEPIIRTDVAIESIPTPLKAETQHSPRPFEEFLLIGPNIEILDTTQSSANIPPSILYRFPGLDKFKDCPIRGSLPDFVFPFGIECTQQKIRYSTDEINEKISDMLFTTKEKQISENTIILVLPTNQPQADKFISKTNPNNFLYCVGLIVQDFYNPHKAGSSSSPTRIKNLFGTSLMLCFLTSYPLLEFFVHFNSNLSNIIKLRKNIFHSNYLNQRKKEEMLKLDILFTIKLLEEELKNSLRDLLIQKIKFSIKTNIQVGELETILESCSEKDSQLQEIKYSSLIAFSILPFKDLHFILTALCLESKLVFFSESICKLTMTMQTCYALIKPFKYPHPMSFSLPRNLISMMLQCPVPFMMGINLSYKKYCEEFEKNKNDLIYIDLDENKFIFDHEKTKSDIKNARFTINKQNSSQIKNEYKKFNPNKSTLNKFKGIHKQQVLYQPTEQHRIAIHNLLLWFSNFFEQLLNEDIQQCEFRDEFRIRFRQTNIYKYSTESEIDEF